MTTQDTFSKIFSWFEDRTKPLLVFILAVVVIGSVIWITVKKMESRELKAQLEYSEIMKLDDEPARILKLEEFSVKHKGELISFQVLVDLGRYYFNKGEFEKAAGYLEDVVNNTEGDIINYLAVDALAPVYVALGKPESAAELYLKKSAFSSNPDPYIFKYNAGKMFQLAGNVQKANEIYQELVENEKTPTKTKLKAEEQLLWIAVSK